MASYSRLKKLLGASDDFQANANWEEREKQRVEDRREAERYGRLTKGFGSISDTLSAATQPVGRPGRKSNLSDYFTQRESDELKGLEHFEQDREKGIKRAKLLDEIDAGDQAIAQKMQRESVMDARWNKQQENTHNYRMAVLDKKNQTKPKTPEQIESRKLKIIGHLNKTPGFSKVQNQRGLVTTFEEQLKKIKNLVAEGKEEQAYAQARGTQKIINSMSVGTSDAVAAHEENILGEELRYSWANIIKERGLRDIKAWEEKMESVVAGHHASMDSTEKRILKQFYTQMGKDTADFMGYELEEEEDEAGVGDLLGQILGSNQEGMDTVLAPGEGGGTGDEAYTVKTIGGKRYKIHPDGSGDRIQ
tara:strand:+ start:28086 stop:29174 length:1089 start_codon:yes stop_codon:yes gene_type:complete